MMTELSEQERRRRRRAGCAWGCGGAFALAALVGAGVGAYLSYANQIPSVEAPVVMLPTPNARDECLAAVALVPPDSRQVLTDLEAGNPVDLRKVVEAAQPALRKVRGSFRYRFGTPPITSYNTAFPELAEYRNIARLFALEARLAEEEGRHADAVRSYLDCYRFGGEVQRGGVLVHGLVGIAIQAIALGPLEDLVPKLNEATALSAARELARHEANSPKASDCFRMEGQYGELGAVEMMQQAGGNPRTLQQVASGTGTQWDWESVKWSMRYAFTPKKEMLENYRRVMTRHVERAKMPFGARGPEPETPKDPLNELLLPAFSGAMFSWDRSLANCRLVQGKLAARAYFLRHGRMPSSMTDVVPEIMPKAPLDWFSGKPLLIGPLEGNGPPAVYSVGPDMDDDGGRALGTQIQQTSDGDLVEVRRRRLNRPGTPGKSPSGTGTPR